MPELPPGAPTENPAPQVAWSGATRREWVQVRTGQRLDRDGGVHVLSAAEWNQRREQLAAMGGPPLP